MTMALRFSSFHFSRERRVVVIEAAAPVGEAMASGWLVAFVGADGWLPRPLRLQSVGGQWSRRVAFFAPNGFEVWLLHPSLAHSSSSISGYDDLVTESLAGEVMVVQVGAGGNPWPTSPATATLPPKGVVFLLGGAVEDPPSRPKPLSE